jgi:hypothetical protein
MPLSEGCQVGGDGAECVTDLVSEEGDRGDANHGNQPYEHPIFNQRGAFFVVSETMHQLVHFETPVDGSHMIDRIRCRATGRGHPAPGRCTDRFDLTQISDRSQ